MQKNISYEGYEQIGRHSKLAYEAQSSKESLNRFSNEEKDTAHPEQLHQKLPQQLYLLPPQTLPGSETLHIHPQPGHRHYVSI